MAERTRLERELAEGDRVVREDGKNILTCAGLCFLGYFGVAGEDGGQTRTGSWA